MASDEEFAEATIGYNDGQKDAAALVQRVTSCSTFQTSLSDDRIGVEICGGLKNVISLAAGYCEGMGLGFNAKSAVMRAGMHEMARFMKRTNAGQTRTIFETSAGMGDLVLTCTAGRGRTLAAAFCQHGMKHGMSTNVESSIQRWNELETQLLNGMKLPDWHNAQQIYQALLDMEAVADFPLFEATYKIGFEGHDPKSLLSALSRSIAMADS
jgi:glycerol-3-phosphate dehydrogenase (NAD+)